MFAGCENIISIKFTSFNTKYITNMKYMFYNCKNLQIVNLSYFNTENVFDMSYMFSNCLRINNINLSYFDTKNIKYMNEIFSNCWELKNLILYSKIKNIGLFEKYEYYQKFNEINIAVQIEKEDINKEIYFLDNYEYEDEKGINHYHDNLKELNKLNTELFINDQKYEYKKYFIPKKEGNYNIKLKFDINLTDCSYMFSGCKNIIDIKFISFNTRNVTNMKYMFHKCKSLKFIFLIPFETKNVISMEGMFSFCENIDNLDLSSFDTKNVLNMNYMFYNCSKLNILYNPIFENINKISMNYMYYLCFNLDIKSFIIKRNECVNKYENEINMTVNVDKQDIKKEIYFLDNYEYIDNEYKICNYHDHLKELNSLNTEIYINDKNMNTKNILYRRKKENIILN